MKRHDTGIDSTLAAIIVLLWLCAMVLTTHGCNAPELTRGTPPSSPSPHPSVRAGKDTDAQLDAELGAALKRPPGGIVQ